MNYFHYNFCLLCELQTNKWENKIETKLTLMKFMEITIKKTFRCVFFLLFFFEMRGNRFWMTCKETGFIFIFWCVLTITMDQPWNVKKTTKFSVICVINSYFFMQISTISPIGKFFKFFFRSLFTLDSLHFLVCQRKIWILI